MYLIDLCLSVGVAACVVQVFHLMPYATTRSILSKQVGDDEQGQT